MDEYRIPRSAIVHVLQGVAVAAKTSFHVYNSVEKWARGVSPHIVPTPDGPGGSEDKTKDVLSLDEWCSALQSRFEDQDESRHIAAVAVAVSFLRGSARENKPVPSKDLDIVWGLIHDALSPPSPTKPAWKANRSSQGFLAVPLCSLIVDGNIDELFRLHVWLPDSERGDADFTIHSHQPFAQSWVLAGDGTDTSWEIEPVDDPDAATHAKYSLAWGDGKKAADNTYKTHQQSSTVVNTRELVRATAVASTAHSRDMSYSIPASSFHTTDVKPDELHATLFFFDSHRGFVKDAPVLGPKHVESSTQLRDPAGMSASSLATAANALRKWEVLMGRGRHHMAKAEWEHALRDLNSALQLCSPEDFPNRKRYESLVYGDLGNTYRRLGKYEQAVEYLRLALDGLPTGMPSVELSGELGVIYRHMNRLEDAKLAFEMQYFMAKDAEFDRATCRAIGNMGMVNYQLFRRTGRHDYLSLATYNLRERVQLARQLQESTGGVGMDQNIKKRWKQEAKTWETIGLSRLSLCCAAAGNFKGAVAAAHEAAELTKTSKDSTVIAMSRLFYGLALLKSGRREDAMQQFNAKKGCTPAIALCKEPSEEHREYLRELIGSGADLDLVDEHGYTAMEYTVFNGDVEMEKLVLDGLCRTHDLTEDEIKQRHTEALLRKGYRELFQEKLRPVLLRGGPDALQTLRTEYAAELAADELKDGMFDTLKFLRYSDLLTFEKLPRSSDSLTQVFAPESGDGRGTEFVIFISYRWLVKATMTNSPDDEDNTQYK
ncbi:tetratricopeptide repeat protein, partial [Candidatus Bathyarchaeota archaeon]|nr:tetratricopeptide repeat protein [Candidatus Bathyarchaeota archaeon]